MDLEGASQLGMQPAEERLAAQEFERNCRWAAAHGDELVKAHSGKCVAILGEKVVAVAGSTKELQRKYTTREGAYITYVLPADVVMSY
jgi:hypothetical protein